MEPGERSISEEALMGISYLLTNFADDIDHVRDVIEYGPRMVNSPGAVHSTNFKESSDA